ncbi:hypothetical protein EDD86DRAFT_126926 [Gorgonomyces haynaldii]|nr:hypothetical protein EDD86DRAFT_126926 [Gorgonomyces haynaldii]
MLTRTITTLDTGTNRWSWSCGETKTGISKNSKAIVRSAKKSSLNDIHQHTKFMVSFLLPVLDFYNSYRVKRLAFTTHLKGQQVVAKIAEGFKMGKKRARLVWGSATFSTSMKGNIPVPNKALVQGLMLHGCEVIFMNEYLTSKRCCGCLPLLSRVRKPKCSCKTEPANDSNSPPPQQHQPGRDNKLLADKKNGKVRRNPTSINAKAGLPLSQREIAAGMKALDTSRKVRPQKAKVIHQRGCGFFHGGNHGLQTLVSTTAPVRQDPSTSTDQSTSASLAATTTARANFADYFWNILECRNPQCGTKRIDRNFNSSCNLMRLYVDYCRGKGRHRAFLPDWKDPREGGRAPKRFPRNQFVGLQGFRLKSVLSQLWMLTLNLVLLLNHTPRDQATISLQGMPTETSQRSTRYSS